MSEDLFRTVSPELREKESRKGIWSEAIRQLASGETLFVKKEDSNRAKGTLYAALRERGFRLRSASKISDEEKGVVFWAEPISKEQDDKPDVKATIKPG